MIVISFNLFVLLYNDYQSHAPSEQKVKTNILLRAFVSYPVYGVIRHYGSAWNTISAMLLRCSSSAFAQLTDVFIKFTFKEFLLYIFVREYISDARLETDRNITKP